MAVSNAVVANLERHVTDVRRVGPVLVENALSLYGSILISRQFVHGTWHTMSDTGTLWTV